MFCKLSQFSLYDKSEGKLPEIMKQLVEHHLYEHMTHERNRLKSQATYPGKILMDYNWLMN